jgi:hypothetical protein
MSLPCDLSNLLIKLDFVGRTKKGFKINWHTNDFVHEDSWVGSVTRSLAGEGRKSLIAYLEQLLIHTAEALETYTEPRHHKMLVEALIKTKEGVLSLVETYYRDPITQSSLALIAQKIDLLTG